MKITAKELREMIREAVSKGLQEAEVSGLGGTPAGPTGGTGGGLAKAGAPKGVSGEDPRWKAQLTDLAKRAVKGDSKAMANALAMSKASQAGTYGKEVFDYLTSWQQQQAQAPAGVAESVMEAKIRKMVKEALKTEKAETTKKPTKK